MKDDASSSHMLPAAARASPAAATRRAAPVRARQAYRNHTADDHRDIPLPPHQLPPCHTRPHGLLPPSSPPVPLHVPPSGILSRHEYRSQGSIRGSAVFVEVLVVVDGAIEGAGSAAGV